MLLPLMSRRPVLFTATRLLAETLRLRLRSVPVLTRMLPRLLAPPTLLPPTSQPTEMAPPPVPLKVRSLRSAALL